MSGIRLLEKECFELLRER